MMRTVTSVDKKKKYFIKLERSEIKALLQLIFLEPSHTRILLVVLER